MEMLLLLMQILVDKFIFLPMQIGFLPILPICSLLNLPVSFLRENQIPCGVLEK